VLVAEEKSSGRAAVISLNLARGFFPGHYLMFTSS
jgi:hypothetical protein